MTSEEIFLDFQNYCNEKFFYDISSCEKSFVLLQLENAKIKIYSWINTTNYECFCENDKVKEAIYFLAFNYIVNDNEFDDDVSRLKSLETNAYLILKNNGLVNA